jgi:signal transduction histidine kinase
VVQRLFGVSMALSADTLGDEARERCLDELHLALKELREALARAPEHSARRRAGFREEIARLRDRHPQFELRVTGEGDDPAPPESLEPLAVSVLVEAVRNARKHAQPTRIDVCLSKTDGVFVLEVVNDGVGAVRRGPTGMGLRLAAFEALEEGGIVEFGALDESGWRVRLKVPLGDRG